VFKPYTALISRRDFVKFGIISAVIISVPILVVNKFISAPKLQKWVWHGSAMGMDINIQLCHQNKAVIDRVISLCKDEVSRLESIFTLYSDDSELSYLNKHGKLKHPSLELVELMSLARKYGDISDGYFDMTLQPVWEIIKKYGIDSPKLKDALALVNYKKVKISPQEIVLENPDMAISLNGIAQGYITDKITNLIESNGIKNALIDIGEIRALGGNESNKPWKIGLNDPIKKDKYFKIIPLYNNAISTTGGYGLVLSEDGKQHHIINPKSGKSKNYYISLSVIAETATKADAFSTAFYLMDIEQIRNILRQFTDIKVILMHSNGQIQTIS